MTGKPSFRQGAQEGNCRPSGVKDCINIHFRGLDACLCSIYSFTLRKEKNRLQPNEKFLSSYKFRVLRMSWKKSARNGNFSLHEEGQNCFFAAFSFYFPVFRRQEFTDRMLAVPPRRFHRKKKEAEDRRFPFAFVL